MKTITLTILAFTLASCTFSGSYLTGDQRFDFNGAIKIIPVEDCKK